MRVQLVPLNGGEPIEIAKDLILVGRKEDCDLRLNHKSVSKLHCVITRSDGVLMIRDLGSTNGTRVNGRRVRRAAMPPDTQLQIAAFAFRVSISPGQAPAAPAQRTVEIDGEELDRLLRGMPDDQDDSDPGDAPGPIPPSLPDDYPDDAT